MFLTKYRPANPVDSFFGEFLPLLRDNEERTRLPMTNVNETDTAFILTMEMPGVDKKDVDVAIDGDHIVITGEKTEKTESEGLLRREIRSETFRRSFLLDATIDCEGVKAKLDNGILKVTLPKKAKSAGKKINID